MPQAFLDQLEDLIRAEYAEQDGLAEESSQVILYPKPKLLPLNKSSAHPSPVCIAPCCCVSVQTAIWA